MYLAALVWGSRKYPAWWPRSMREEPELPSNVSSNRFSTMLESEKTGLAAGVLTASSGNKLSALMSLSACCRGEYELRGPLPWRIPIAVKEDIVESKRRWRRDGGKVGDAIGTLVDWSGGVERGGDSEESGCVVGWWGGGRLYSV